MQLPVDIPRGPVAGGVDDEMLAIGKVIGAIRALFAAQGVAARVTGGEIKPACIEFYVDAAADAGAGLRLAGGLARTLQVPRVRISSAPAGLVVAVPRALAAPLPLTALLAQVGPLPAWTAVLGVTAEERPLLLRLPSPEAAHILVAGAPDAGKTTLLRTLALSLAAHNRPAQLQLLLIGPGAGGLAPPAALPRALAAATTDAARGGHLVTWLRAEMERRDRDGHHLPRIVCLIDDVEDILAVGGKNVEDALVRLALRGREAGLHLIVATGMPASTAIGDQLRGVFPVRVVGCVPSAAEARAATGVKNSGAERLLGRGHFMAVAAGGVTEFQAACTPDSTLPGAAGACAAEVLAGLRAQPALFSR